MSKDIWDSRRRGLEEEFFIRQNKELLEKLHAKEEAEKLRRDLRQATGIKDESTIDSLIEAKFTPASLLALSLVPLVLVAWADGKMEPEEREAILKAASAEGLDEGNSAYPVLVSWLETKPKPELFATWEKYVHALQEATDSQTVSQLKTKIIGSARNVAEAAGGFLGLGNKISKVEADLIDRLERVFG